MVKQLLSMVGMSKRGGFLGGFLGRKSRLPFMSFLPGGVLPVAAYLAWTNRDKIRGLYNRYTHHDAPAGAAA